MAGGCDGAADLNKVIIKKHKNYDFRPYFFWSGIWIDIKNTFGVLSMQNQFVQIKVLKIHYRKKIVTFTHTQNSNYGGNFKVTV